MFARLLRARGLKARSINTIHNVYEGGWHRMALYAASDVFSDHVTAVSTAALERFTSLWAVPARKISLLTNGIDTREFAPDKGRRRRVRRQMGAEMSFVWLAVGRIAPAKDYPNLLNAFREVRNVIPEAQLWIAGEGEPLETRSGEAVRFLGLRRDVPDLLDAADGFVLSSAWEGMPLAVGEAMAMEKPVVATDVGGVRELVAEAGLIVKAEESAALADAMLAVMTMPVAERAALGKRARGQVEVCYSMDAKVVEWEDLYRKWLLQR
jgi:glycosyltransferase involved in cell wall biosynthesis